MAYATVLLLCGILYAASAQQKNDCVLGRADVVFVIDSSGSISIQDYARALNFTAQLAKGFDIGPQKVRIALVEYSTSATLVFDFSKYGSSNDVVKAILSTIKTGGGTATHLALKQAEIAFAKARPGIPHILYVITDGTSNNFDWTVTASKLLHQKGINVISVGVGIANPKELQEMASNPNLVFNFQNFNELSKRLDFISQQQCKVGVNVLSTTPKTPTCTLKVADVGFILDSSGSIKLEDYKKSLDFVSNLADTFDIGPNKVRVGLIEYSSAAQIVFNFLKYTTALELKKAILATPKTNGGTQTDKALQLARTKLFDASSGRRMGVPQILYVITDGVSNSFTLTVNASKSLHQNGINVISVGVGIANPKELQEIASNPNFVFNFKNFLELSKHQYLLAEQHCKAATKSCMDKRSCSIYPREFCKLKEYRSFMLTECKLYCDLCNEDF